TSQICLHCICLFFFQAEDGIRDRNVTGVQTCALPILFLSHTDESAFSGISVDRLFVINLWIALSILLLVIAFVIGLVIFIQHRKIGRASCRERVSVAVVGGAVRK